MLGYLSRRNAAFRLLSRYVAPLWPLLAVGLLANAAAACGTGLIPTLAKWSVDNGLGSDSSVALFISASIVAVVVVRSLASYIGSVSIAHVGQKVTEKLQADFFEKLVCSDLAFVNGQHSGYFLSQLSGDVQRLQNVLVTSSMNFFQNLLTVIVIVAGLFWFNPVLAALGTVAAPSATVLSRVLRSAARRQAHKNMCGLADLTSLLSEVLAGFRIVKAYGREEYELRRCRKIVSDVRRNGTRAVMISSVAAPFVEMLSGFGIALVVCFAGVGIRSGHTTVGQLTAFLVSLPLAYQPLKGLLGQQIVFQDGVAASERILSVLEHPRYFRDRDDAKPLKLTSASVVFDHVGFSYQKTPYSDAAPNPEEDQPATISDLSLELSKGRTVALVGPSGSGKSTVLNLLMRFYTPLSGAIRIDGQDIAEVTEASLRSNIALVTQDPFLFDDTIEANIAYGAPNGSASFNDIVRVAKDADAHDFIVEQPLGYKTRIGQSGVRLSGGQKQRIAIARAMLRDAPILLLDEATSSLDSRSERQIQKALSSLMKGRAVLVIAHRLSTVRNSHRIYVLSKGRVVDQGTHEELINRKGLYAELYRSQFGEDEEQKGPGLEDRPELGVQREPLQSPRGVPVA